eukprot:5608901-Pyramimonas_sp.AAC.2
MVPAIRSPSVVGVSSNWVKRGWESYTVALHRHPITTQMVTSATLWCACRLLACAPGKSRV